jgi:hypothetical protein
VLASALVKLISSSAMSTFPEEAPFLWGFVWVITFSFGCSGLRIPSALKRPEGMIKKNEDSETFLSKRFIESLH